MISSNLRMQGLKGHGKKLNKETCLNDLKSMVFCIDMLTHEDLWEKVVEASSVQQMKKGLVECRYIDKTIRT